MTRMRLWMPLTVFALLLFTTPARAQYSDPDPCFDASMSKSQYDACMADSGGGNTGSGGATMPPCLRCVVGYWNPDSPYPSAECKDPSAYLPSAGSGDYSNCRGETRCWPGPYGYECEVSCSGTPCYRV